ncbi:hypothetical protein ACHAXR_010092, partial [Thalassiosira sp. AJA248-18]
QYPSSPPPDSIHSGLLTTLSPPPLSMKSGAEASSPQISSSGSQSLFSGNYNYNNPNNNNMNNKQGGYSAQQQQQNQQQQQPQPSITGASAGGNTAPSTTKKRRPPLPPRWAIGGGGGGGGVASSHHAGMYPPNTNPGVVAAAVGGGGGGGGGGVGGGGGDMVDVVPSHLPPPKQIGPLSHRRVLSTGDASFLSNLTDPDSIPGIIAEEEGGEDENNNNSPPLAGLAAAAGGVVGSSQNNVPIISSSGVAPPNTTTNARNSQPLPMNPARKRGVSWDFGAQVAASHSESLDGGGGGGSVNRYKNEEEAAFDTLGILQPLLSLDDGDEGDNIGDIEDPMGLMQPILVDDDDEDGDDNMEEPMLGGSSSAFTNSVIGVANASVLPPSPPPPPPPPPPQVVRKQKSEGSRLGHAGGSGPSSRDLSAPSQKNEKKIHTQFEDEAELAILAALNAHNMQSIDTGAQRSHEGGHSNKQDLSPIDDIEHISSQEEEGDNVLLFPPELSLGHRKDVSALTIQGFDNSPKSTPMHSRKKGESILEDSAWTEEYDAQGRITGMLPEEQDSMLLEEEQPGSVDLSPRVAAAASARPPFHPLKSSKDQHASQRSNASKRVVKDAGLESKSDQNECNKPNVGVVQSDPTKTTGLRHRRNRTIAAKNMADEMAQLAALHDGGSNHTLHQRTMTVATQKTSDGGIDNLLAGVDLLGQQDDSTNGYDNADDYPNNTGVNHAEVQGDEDHQGNAPQDEETGNVKISSNHNTHLPRGLSLGRRSEMLYHLRIWYNDLIKPKLPSFVRGATHSVLFIMVPLLSIAFILFYAVGNPLVGSNERFDETLESSDSSWQVIYLTHLRSETCVSWWVVFFVRQIFVLLVIKTEEVIVIDILALRTPFFLKTIGAFGTLMMVQARGWPYILTFWAVLDFCVLFGNHQFAKHWLFWQDWVDIFNATNPAGNFLHSEFYMRVLLAMIYIGVTASLKRLALATFLGRRSYAHYGPELEIILGRMLLISQVAHLARQIESQVITSHVSDGYAYALGMQDKAIPFQGLTTDSEDEGSPTRKIRKSFDELSHKTGNNSEGDSPRCGFGQSLLEAGIGSKLVSSLSRPRLESSRTERMQSSKSSKNLMGSSAKLAIMQLLEEWEEPDIKANAKAKASIKDILQFRQAISLMDDTYPFTPAFGPARTRAMCVDSSERLFETLQQRTTKSSRLLLPFETISEIAYDAKGVLMRDKVKALIRLFRPDRKGFLTKLDFVSSIDDVYKDLRLFRASLANSSSIDDSFETIVNTLFFTLSIFIVLLIGGFTLWEPILSFSAFFFSFSFMFGPASSKYFEGILLIFIRRPYDIGDKIALSDPENDTSASGSSTWFVERVTLFTTTCRFATTNEVATYSNGSLARLRIINAKRSPKAIVYVYMKFGSDVPYQMIKVYQTAIENFVKSRPREWSQLNGFRATRVEMELNFIEYVIVATHREMWQNVGPILQSQADLAAFSLEVSKKLNLRYHNPPKPILLSLTKMKNAAEAEAGNLAQMQQVAKMFGAGLADDGD